MPALRARYLSLALVLALVVGLAPPAAGQSPIGTQGRDRTERVIAALATRQLEELGIPKDFLPFLRDDQRVETGRALIGSAAPDLNQDGMPEVVETDMRYSYSTESEPQPLPTIRAEVDTRITVRAGRSGKKLWGKRYDRDAWPVPMRVGEDGRRGLLVISGIWNFYGTTEESTLTLDAFEGRRGRHLWSRSYKSITSYEALSTVATDAPLILARFDALKGRADDLMLGLATIVNSPLTETMATRVVVIDGATGEEHAHPKVDVGVEWWPIPLPVKDLDGDDLDDYATTNNIGVDPGEGQEQPSFGGTVYSRKGTDGSAIWTTSGIEMAGYAFPRELPDTVAGKTPEVGLVTYVARRDPLVPVPVPVVDGLYWKPRVYLFEGRFGPALWHRPFDWMFSPGDIAGSGQHELILAKFRAFFKKGKTVFDQLAVAGDGDRLWKKRSVWRFKTMPCPENLCFGGWGLWLDTSPDIQPDGVRDVFLAQHVQQNAAFEDSITRVFNGRTGRMRFQDKVDMQPVRVAIDGRGTDFVAYKFKKKKNKVYMTTRDGNNEVLWGGMLGGPNKLLPRSSGFWADGFVLPGDRCADLVITGFEDDESFYGVFDGGSGRLMWWRWTGSRSEHPTFKSRTDHNSRC